MSVSSVFKMIFMADDRGSISRMRNVLKGVGEQSYVTFNAISRNMSKMEKSTSALIGKMSMLVGGGGLMYGMFKSLNYSIIQSNSLITTNRILLEEIIGNKGKAREMVNVVQEIAGSFGGDVNELMTAGRGLSQVMRQIDKNFQPIHLDKMLRLVNVVSSLDTENRGLSYTSFSFKEALQGVGSGDWRSMRNRLEMNLGKTYEKAITKAVRSGNMDEVTRLFEEAFKNIGIDAGQIMGRLMSEGLTQNVHRTASYINRLFQMLGESSFAQLTKPLARLNFFLSDQFKKDTGFMKYISNLSQAFSDKFVTPLTEMMNKVGFAIEPIAGEMGVDLVNALISVGSVFKNLIMLPIEFISGLMGVSTSISDIEGKVSSFNGFLKTTAELGTKISSSFKELREPLNMLGESINNLVVSLLKLTNIDKTAKLGGGLTGLTKNALTLTAGVTNNTAEGIKMADSGIEGIGMGGVMTGLSLISMIAMMRGGRGGRMSAKKMKAQEQADIANAKRFGSPTSNKGVWNDPEKQHSVTTLMKNQTEVSMKTEGMIKSFNTKIKMQNVKTLKGLKDTERDTISKFGGKGKDWEGFRDSETKRIASEIARIEKANPPLKGIMDRNAGFVTVDPNVTRLKNKMAKINEADAKIMQSRFISEQSIRENNARLQTSNVNFNQNVPNAIPAKNSAIDLNKKPSTMGSLMNTDIQTLSMGAMTLMQMGSLFKEGFSKHITPKLSSVGIGFLNLIKNMNPLTALIGTAIVVFEGLIWHEKKKLDILEAQNRLQNENSLRDNKNISKLQLFGMENGLNRVGIRNLISKNQLNPDMIKNLIRGDIMDRGGLKESSASHQFIKIQEELNMVKAMGMDAKQYSMNTYSADLTGQDFKSLAINMDLSIKDGTVTKETMNKLERQINKALGEARGKDNSKAKPTGEEFFQMQLDASKKGSGR